MLVVITVIFFPFTDGFGSLLFVDIETAFKNRLRGWGHFGGLFTGASSQNCPQ